MKYKKYPRPEKASNGYWYILYIDPQGRHARKSLKERNENRAHAKFTAWMKQEDSKVLGYDLTGKPLLFFDACTRYLDEGTLALSPNSRQRHIEACRNHLKPFFGNVPLKSIGPEAIESFITSRQRVKAAPNTIHKEIAALSAIFRFYQRREIVSANPVRVVLKPRIKVLRPNYAPSPEELVRIFENLSLGARRYFVTLLNTGCRLSEIQQANVGDVNLSDRRLRITRKGGDQQVIGLNTAALDAIKEELEARGNPGKTEPLFLNRYGKRYLKIRIALAEACKKAGVPRTTHHGLRHAYAHVMLDRGVDLRIVSILLGHKSTHITDKVYGNRKAEKVVPVAQEFVLDGV